MGTAENDLLFGRFAEAHLAAMGETQLARLETLLEAADPDLMNWVTQRKPAPPELDHDVMKMLQAFARAGVKPA